MPKPKQNVTDNQVRIARISAWQAVAVALIGLGGGIASTLASQGIVRSARAGQVGDAQATVAVASTATEPAPAMNYNWVRTDLGLETCKDRARKVLVEYGATDIDPESSHTVFAYSGRYSVMFVCLTDFNVILLAAYGPDVRAAETIRSEVGSRFDREGK
jgi:hypothetical protein